ncbi:LytR/AlgR family response regulator transcription factor [Marinobacter sp. X15-166B]|uniref:LytR/AlgR family response regulator transcription factor n=1 Tax=Marinobacter sp. X15-166B TaxID=1897620 RepID=UPI00085C9326|nr:LytTR family DNA-binding domain-containing protein [Marinobacter sp. X15-166B]OEY66449.1 DNA-binding response regulator [Marinobacter sp. X15-166B]
MTHSSFQHVVIADDEPLARERIRRLVETIPGYRVSAEAADGHEVLSAVAAHPADIVLLDIRMPGMDGMDAAMQLQSLSNPPAIIFCTAFDHYAITAFEVQAVAYLMKPVRKETLSAALARAGRVNRVQLQALQVREQASPGQLAVKTHRGTELIDMAEVRYCAADQKYVTLHHSRGETITDYTLKELEAAFADTLLRIHRNTLVGVDHIQGLSRTAEGHWQLNLRDQPVALAVSRRHVSRVRQWLQEHLPG